jgi:DnaJ domain
MLIHLDIHGYYRILGVQPPADGDAIKQAYRRLAKDTHPDSRRFDLGATAKFQKLAEAYETLVDPEKRAQYDSVSLINSSYDARPLSCALCGTVSPQLRYAVFPYISSLSPSHPYCTFEGLYCSRCAQVKALQAVVITWLVGWWRIPKGPILSIRALYKIFTEDSYPARRNIDLLIQQAFYYLSMGQPDLASNALSHAEQFVKTGIDSQRLAELRRHVSASPPSRSEWKIYRRWFVGIQLAALGFVSLVTIAIGLSLHPGKHTVAAVANQRDGGVLVIDARGLNVK